MLDANPKKCPFIQSIPDTQQQLIELEKPELWLLLGDNSQYSTGSEHRTGTT